MSCISCKPLSVMSRPTLLLFCVLYGELIGATPSMTYAVELTNENYTSFLNGDNVNIVYFFKEALPSLTNFFKEVVKSKAIIQVYKVKFALVDCTKHGSLGYCTDSESQEKVYMFRGGHLLFDVGLNSMFDANSIISNVLQVILLREMPILQTVSERERFEAENKGLSDVIFTYQFAFGTYDHRIMMEIVYVFHERFRFAVSNSQQTVEHLPGFTVDEKSGVWLLRCKDVTSADQPCPAYKYKGQMSRTLLAKFFRGLQLPVVHDLSEDGDYNQYSDNDLDTVYVYYQDVDKEAMMQTVLELKEAYIGHVGIIMVNLDVVDGFKHGYQRDWKVPALGFLRAGQSLLRCMPPNDSPIEFLAKQLGFRSAEMSGPPMETHDTAKRSENKSDPEVAHVDVVSDKEEVKQDLIGEIDDKVLQMASSFRSIPLNRIALPALNDQSFFEITKDKPLLLVLFYVHFEPMNELALKVFAEADRLLSLDGIRSMATVNCYDWTDVCSAVNMSVYPTVKVYRKGQDVVPYHGLVSVSALVRTVKLFLADSPIILLSAVEVSEYFNGRRPRMSSDIAQVFVLGAFLSMDEKNATQFLSVAKKLHGEHFFALALDDTAKNSCRMYGSVDPPCILINRRHHSVSPVNVLVPNNDGVEGLFSAIQLKVLATFPELTTENFSKYLARRQPFVILFTSNREGNLFNIMTDLANVKPQQDVLYTWMNLSNEEDVGRTLLRHYIEDHKQEELLIIDHAQGAAFHFTNTLATMGSIEAWVRSVLAGGETVTKHLADKKWTALYPGYDFLKQMDDDAMLRDTAEHCIDRSLRHANEFGVGMTSDDGELPPGYPTGMAEDTNEDLSVLRTRASDGDASKDVEMDLADMLHSRLFVQTDHQSLRASVELGQQEHSHPRVLIPGDVPRPDDSLLSKPYGIKINPNELEMKNDEGRDEL